MRNGLDSKAAQESMYPVSKHFFNIYLFSRSWERQKKKRDRKLWIEQGLHKAKAKSQGLHSALPSRYSRIDPSSSVAIRCISRKLSKKKKMILHPKYCYMLYRGLKHFDPLPHNASS